MQLDNNNNLILNIKDKTQLYSEEEIRKALENYQSNKIATNEVSFCANYDGDTEEAIHKYYGHKENKTIYGGSFSSLNNSKLILKAEPINQTDPIVNAVREDLLQRSQLGISKYKVTLARTDLSLRDWHQHLYEEILDSANYLKRIIIELDKKENNTLLETHTMD